MLPKTFQRPLGDLHGVGRIILKCNINSGCVDVVRIRLDRSPVAVSCGHSSYVKGGEILDWQKNRFSKLGGVGIINGDKKINNIPSSMNGSNPRPREQNRKNIRFNGHTRQFISCGHTLLYKQLLERSSLFSVYFRTQRKYARSYVLKHHEAWGVNINLLKCNGNQMYHLLCYG
jgi:hypothetical protein